MGLPWRWNEAEILQFSSFLRYEIDQPRGIIVVRAIGAAGAVEISMRQAFKCLKSTMYTIMRYYRKRGPFSCRPSVDG